MAYAAWHPFSYFPKNVEGIVCFEGNHFFLFSAMWVDPDNPGQSEFCLYGHGGWFEEEQVTLSKSILLGLDEV